MPVANLLGFSQRCSWAFRFLLWSDTVSLGLLGHFERWRWRQYVPTATHRRLSIWGGVT